MEYSPRYNIRWAINQVWVKRTKNTQNMFHKYHEINLEISNRENWKTPEYLETEQLTSNQPMC